MKLFTRELYAFTRSGLHCDLHPRWRGDGTQVAFDSIHEGTPQPYVHGVKAWVAPSNGQQPRQTPTASSKM